MRRAHRIALLLVLGALAACSSASESPLDEYPPQSDGGDDSDGSTPKADAADGGADAPEPIAGKKILGGSVTIEGVTTDGALVLMVDADLSVWPAGAPAPTVFVAGFDFGTDSFVVRGRFVGAWLGQDPGASPLHLWASTGGVQTVAPLAYRDALYAKTDADDFAYFAPAASGILYRDVHATTAGAGAGPAVVTDLDTGLIDDSCRPTIAYVGTSLLVAGCAAGATTPQVATYALDGSGVTQVVLASSAPGLWLDHARAHALVQTASASSIRPVSGAGSVAVDGPIVQAAFSKDDSKVLYLTASGAVKRASTTAPASPVTLASSAVTIRALSPDARYAILATTGSPSDETSDLVVVDANAPATPHPLATEKAVTFGTSRDGSKLVYVTGADLGIEGALWVTDLPSGTPQKLSDDAQRIVFDGDVVYWIELVPATKSATLKAARVASPGTIVTVDEGLDPLTAQAVVTGTRLLVASKLGLWEYPALTP